MRGLEAVIDDAIDRAIQNKLIYDDLRWYAWPQTWPDTSCGFGGPAGQAFCSTQTVAIEFPHERIFYIYHGYRFAYTVGESDDLWESIMKHHLPGHIDRDKVIALQQASRYWKL